MGVFLFIVGVVWIIVAVCKDAGTKDVTSGHNVDFRQAVIDKANGVSQKTIDKRMNSGYYNKD